MKKDRSMDKYVMVRVPANLHRRVRMKVAKEERTISQVVRGLLELWLQEEVKVPNESLVFRSLTAIKGIGPRRASKLAEAGIDSREKLAEATPARVADILGVQETTAEKYINQASRLMTAD